ncbi:MAG: hypothetical protein ACE15E_00550 [Acidobacteriota bacterium]
MDRLELLTKRVDYLEAKLKRVEEGQKLKSQADSKRDQLLRDLHGQVHSFEAVLDRMSVALSGDMEERRKA